MPTSRRHVMRFVVLFPGRSGSTYVISALDAHPAILAKGEVLDPMRPEGPEKQLEWTRRYLRGPILNRNRAVGFKTKLRDVLDQDGFATILRDLDVRIIYLDRRNDVKHAISRITARRLKDTIGRWNRYDGDARLDPIEVDLEDFQTRLEAVEAEKATISEYVGRLEGRLPAAYSVDVAFKTPVLLPSAVAIATELLHLDYEDLLADPTATFHRILAFLGLPPAPIQGSTLKNTSDDLREVVTNFDELRARYTGTPYEAMFDEVLVP